MLFKSFNNKKEDKKRLEILLAIRDTYNKMENYNEQHKKMKKGIEIECLRTAIHGGNA